MQEAACQYLRSLPGASRPARHPFQTQRHRSFYYKQGVTSTRGNRADASSLFVWIIPILTAVGNKRGPKKGCHLKPFPPPPQKISDQSSLYRRGLEERLWGQRAPARVVLKICFQNYLK